MQIMRNIDFSHDIQEAAACQEKYAQEILVRPGNANARIVAGTDVSYMEKTQQAFAAVVVVDRETKKIIEEATWVGPVNYPYHPGLLSLREAPCLLQVFHKLQTVPEAILVDGNGQIHPRRFGLACHIGLMLGLPTVGCAKNFFIGEHDELPNQFYAEVELKDKGQIIGKLLRSQPNAPPVYISVGNLFDIPSAVALVKNWMVPNNRHPLPIFYAHHLCAKLRKQ